MGDITQNSEWYMSVTYDEAKKIIDTNIGQMSRSFVAIGYYLKHIRDNGMYLEDGYKNIWEFAEDRYGIGRSTTTRWMSINDRFSRDGNSPVLADRYKNFGKSQLQEMLYLTDEQAAEVTEDMTVKEIRELKKPEPVKDEAWFVREFLERHGGESYLPELMRICRENKDGGDRAKAAQKQIAPYGCNAGFSKSFSYDFHVFSGGIDFEANGVRLHMKYGRFVAEMLKLYNPEDEKWVQKEPETAENGQKEAERELRKPDKVAREYLDAAARHLIKVYFNWMQEDFSRRVTDVTTSPGELKEKIEGQSRRHWFALEKKVERGLLPVACINLFDEYVQIWDENSRCIGDYDWFYLAAAIQTQWNVVSLEKAQKKEEKPECATSHKAQEPVVIDGEYRECCENAADEPRFTATFVRDILWDKERELRQMEECNAQPDGELPERMMQEHRAVVAGLRLLLEYTERVEGDNEEN